jgi:hypothetical protein
VLYDSQTDKMLDLPYYFNIDNDKREDYNGTIKNSLLIIRVFNWKEIDQKFKVGLHLYHGLFLPYLAQL